MTDLVNHPPHYTQSEAKCATCGRRVECIDVVRSLPFNVGNIIKYLWRFNDKNGIEDLKKAQWYLNDLISNLEKQNSPKFNVTVPATFCVSDL